MKLALIALTLFSNMAMAEVALKRGDLDQAIEQAKQDVQQSKLDLKTVFNSTDTVEVKVEVATETY